MFKKRRLVLVADGPDEAPEAAPTVEQLRSVAVGALARRDYSRAEMRRKLLVAGADEVGVDSILDDLEQERLLSDRRFAENIVRARGARFGSRRVAGDLRAKGVADGAEDLIAGLKADDLAHAQAAWERKFGAAPANQADEARQMRFLLGRGFPFDVIRRVVPRAARAGTGR